jgi:CheY-like chemotaxis protein
MAEREIQILIVEDNPDDAALALHALRKLDIAETVQLTRDGAEAVDFLFGTGVFTGRRPARPRLVLLDLKVPKIGGLEVLRLVRSHVKFQLLPIVVLTSSRDERDIEECYRLGANSYVVKPVDFVAFTEMMRAITHYWLDLNQANPAAPARLDRKAA